MKIYVKNPMYLHIYVVSKRIEGVVGRVRRADEDVSKNARIGKVNKKRPLGRPATRRKDTVEKDTRSVDGSAPLDWSLDRENGEVY